MANKLEQIALKKQREAEEAREAEIKSLASVIASETISRIKTLSADEKKPLEATISELSKGLAEAVALSNEKLGGGISVSFAKLVDNFKSAIPEKFDNTKNEELFAKIADDILKFDNAIKSLELNPTINLKGITATELKAEVDRLIEKLPKDAKDSVKIEYEKAGATNYINVRLTDGINFYKALGGGGGGGSAGPVVAIGDDKFAVPVVNPDGTPISAGGGPSGPIEVDNFPTEYPLPDDQLNALMPYVPEENKLVTLIDDTTTTDVTYIGYALPTGSAIATSGAVWRIKKIDESTGVTTIKWADGDTLFNNIWDNRVSLTYN